MANNVQQQANDAIGQAVSVGNEVQKQATDAIGNARTQAENVANNLQQQANAAIGQAFSVGNDFQKQASNGIENARAQVGSIVSNVQQLANNGLSQARGIAEDIQKQAVDALSNGRTLVANILGNLGSQAADTVQTVISTFTIGIRNVTSFQRTSYSNRDAQSNNPAFVLNTIAGGSSPFPAFSSRIIQATSLDSLQRTTTTSSDCGNNGDLQTFAACSAAKAAGLCTLDVFKSQQCRATCGNKCKLFVIHLPKY